MIRSVVVGMNADITEYRVIYGSNQNTEQKHKQKHKQTKKQKEKNKTKQNRQPEGLYIPGSGMLVFSRTLLGS